MSTDATWKIQVSPKTGNTLINVRGDSAEEVKAGLDAVAALAGDIASVEALLVGAGAATPLVHEVPSAAVPTPVAAGGGAPPAYNPPAPAGAPEPPSCPHGPRVWRTGSSAKGPWGAWFCPTPKNTPGQCDPEWDRTYGK